MITWLAGGDAEMLDTLPAATLASFAVLFPYGPGFGAHGGPGRQTPQAWTAAQPQPKWVVFFPGANPAQALAYARAVGAKGVVVDIEPGVEKDAWTLSVAASFGDYMAANGMPACVYSHEATCAKLAAHFTAQWWDGQAKPATLPSRVAVQYGQQTASNGVIFDLDACDSYFVNLDPPAPPPDPPEDDDMAVTRVGIAAGGTSTASGLFLIYEGPFGLFKEGIATPADVTAFNGIGWIDIGLSLGEVNSLPTAAQVLASFTPVAPATAAEVAQVDADVKAIPAASGGLTAAEAASLTDVQTHVDADLH